MTPGVDLDGDELIATRHLHADLARVWEAFTTPSHLAAFWGGHHAAVPPDSVRLDLRVGGVFELETRGPDGSRHRLQFRYEVVEPPTRLVLSEPRTGITTQIRLRPGRGGTTVVVHQRRLPPELRTEQARTGLAGILERLDAVVHATSGDRGNRVTEGTEGEDSHVTTQLQTIDRYMATWTASAGATTRRSSAA